MLLVFIGNIFDIIRKYVVYQEIVVDDFQVPFYQRNYNKIHWPSISSNVNMPIKFFEKNLHHVHWPSLCLNTGLSVDFFEKHIAYVNHWSLLCQNNNMPVTFF